MAVDDAARQYSFRLSPRARLTARGLHGAPCRREGLDVNRTDVVRMLLRHALDATQCNIGRLVGRPSRRGRERQ